MPTEGLEWAEGQFSCPKDASNVKGAQYSFFASRQKKGLRLASRGVTGGLVCCSPDVKKKTSVSVLPWLIPSVLQLKRLVNVAFAILLFILQVYILHGCLLCNDIFG